MEKEKKKIRLSIVFVLLGLLFICGGVILYVLNGNEDNKKDDEVNNNKKNEIVEEDKYIDDGVAIHDMEDGSINLKKEELVKYIDMYKVENPEEYAIIHSISSTSDDNLTNYQNAKERLSSRLVKPSDYFEVKVDDFVKSKEVPNSPCLGVYENGTTKAIRKETLDKYYKYYYGENESFPSLEFTPFIYEGFRYYFDKNNNYYVGVYNCGGEMNPFAQENFISAYKEGDFLYINSTFDYGTGYGNVETFEKVTLSLKWEESTKHYIFDSLKIEDI